MSSNFKRITADSLKDRYQVDAAVNALSERLGFGAAGPSNAFRGAGLLDIAESLALGAGIDRNAVSSPAQLFRTCFKSDTGFLDFEAVFARLVRAAMLEGFEAQSNSWRDWTQQTLISRFVRFPRKRVIGFDLETVPEGSSIPSIDVPSESKDTDNATTKGVIIRMTREEFFNEDLNFIDLARAAGCAAARAINADVYGLLSSNPRLIDSGELFNTTAVDGAGGHANTAAVNATPGSSSLQIAKAAIRKQCGKPGTKALGLRPRFLLVPADLEETGWAALGTPFGLGEPGSGQERALLNAGRMQLIAEPALDRASGTAWYVAADPADEALVEVAFVGDEMNPRLAGSRRNFNNDCFEACITFDYAVSPGNWRAGYKNNGA